MIVPKITFRSSYNAPNPKEVDYWIDLKENPYGAIIKYYDGIRWVNIAAANSFNPLDYFNKREVSELISTSISNSEATITADLEALEDKVKELQNNWENINDTIDNRILDFFVKKFKPITDEQISNLKE